MSMLCKSVKPTIFRAVTTSSRQFSTSSNYDFLHSSEHKTLEKEGTEKYLPVYKKMNQKELSELLFIHGIPDSSLTPYIFTGPETSARECQKSHGSKRPQTDLSIRKERQTVLSSMEQFLSQYHQIQKIENSSGQSVKGTDEINSKDKCHFNELNVQKQIESDNKLALDGRQLDVLFGVDTEVSSKCSDESYSEDSFYNVTDILNQYLHSAGKNINRLFNTDPFTLHKEETCALLSTNVDSCDNESLHNIMDPLKAFTPSCSEGSGDVHYKERHPLGQMFMNSVYYCVGSEGQNAPQNQSENNNNLPNLDQLRLIQGYMAEHLPFIFSQRHDYAIYRQDLVFENNWVAKPYSTVGLIPYSLQLLKLRFKVHMRYANVRAKVLKITVHEEDGTVRIRWRVSGLPQMRALKFWNFLPWNFKKTLNEGSEWYDGFSILYVCDTGHVYKHTMQRVISDEETTVAKEPKEKLVEKLKKIATPAPAAAPM